MNLLSKTNLIILAIIIIALLLIILLIIKDSKTNKKKESMENKPIDPKVKIGFNPNPTEFKMYSKIPSSDSKENNLQKTNSYTLTNLNINQNAYQEEKSKKSK